MAMFEKRSPVNPLAARQQPQPIPPPAEPPQFLRESEVRTSIAADAVINGKLSFTTPTRVEGKLKGELRCTQLLIIGANAVVEGWVKADELRIEGVVRGEVAETRKVEIRDRGRLIGKVGAQLLIMHEGSFFDGECTVGPDASFAEEGLETGTDAADG